VSEVAAQQWRELCEAFKLYVGRLNRNTAVNVNSQSLRDETRELARTYFRGVRHSLQQLQLSDIAEPLSIEFEALIVLAEGLNATASYKKHVQAIRKLIPRVTTQLEIQSGSANFVSSTETDQRILGTLKELVPSAALSYEQARADMADPKRISFRGPAHELRESLREVLDRFASPEEMEKAAVKREKNVKGDEIYTMKQKVRFIFKSRERNTSESASPRTPLTWLRR
jgi:hypothetical protein